MSSNVNTILETRFSVSFTFARVHITGRPVVLPDLVRLGVDGGGAPLLAGGRAGVRALGVLLALEDEGEDAWHDLGAAEGLDGGERGVGEVDRHWKANGKTFVHVYRMRLSQRDSVIKKYQE